MTVSVAQKLFEMSWGVGQGTALAQTIDPGITPKTDAPWITFLQDIGGWLQTTAIVIGGIVAIILMIQMMFAKLNKRSMDDETVSKFMWVLVACAIITAVSSVIRWASGLSVLFVFN
ncbi:hypothetical protein [Glutamicibacter uratoxydans]|uniref:hypothetical protein n=1 Tax=Glutamicibacter uratoxydans TaxID=43667 RepID=UPI003D6EA654